MSTTTPLLDTALLAALSLRPEDVTPHIELLLGQAALLDRLATAAPTPDEAAACAAGASALRAEVTLDQATAACGAMIEGEPEDVGGEVPWVTAGRVVAKVPPTWPTFTTRARRPR